MESFIAKTFVQDERLALGTVLFCSRAASAASFGNVLMAGQTIRHLTHLLAAAAVVATAFAMSQPATGLIDPGTRSDDVPDQLSITRFTEPVEIESKAPSMAQLQILDTERPQACPGVFVAAHLLMTARHCVMTHAEAANTSLNVGAKTIRGLELLLSQADLDFSLLWVNSDDSPAPLNLGTPTTVIRTRLIDRLPLLEQAKPTAATELRAALK